ncbi:MAG TPA: cupin domain-containing protein [Stellaceae bacterium]|nr:cupin domain-containing protein [Stellaceae bacterium]
MRINADLFERAVVDTAALPWTPSPEPGVERKMLERDGGEVARATSLVRFAPGSRFAAHEHGGGEEILVLDGVFSDEHGDYPAGTYLRNPPGSRHAPYTAAGCVLFVKLRQFAPDDTRRVVLDTRKAAWAPGKTDAYDEMLLHQHGAERVYLFRWHAGKSYPLHYHRGGEEIFILEGTYADEHGRYPAGTWVRAPVGSCHAPKETEGALFYAKLGHLPAREAAA